MFYSGDTPFQVSASATTIYYISLHSPLLGGVKIKVITLDPLTGHKIDQYTLGSDSEMASPESILFVGANSAAPILAWTDKAYGILKVNIIGTKSVSTFKIESKGEEKIVQIILHAPHRINSAPHFLVHFSTARNNWAEVFHIDLKASSVAKAYGLPRLAGKGAFSTSTVDANVYFTRITADEVILVSSASHGILARWPIESSSIAGLAERADAVHAVSEVASRSGSAYAVRSAVLLSNGDWVLIRNGEPSWVRTEALAGTTVAIWADLAANEGLAHQLEIEGHANAVSAYIHRAKRHVKDLQTLATWLRNLPTRIAKNFASDKGEPAGDIQHDRFGFRKLVVAATENGRLIALDAGNAGQIIFNIPIADMSLETKMEPPQIHIQTDGHLVIKTTTLEKHVPLKSHSGHPILLSAPNPSQNTGTAQQEITYSLIDGRLRGYLAEGAESEPLWSFHPAAGEEIRSVTARPIEDPVASIGTVLGDRRVLYKYLNPNLALVTTVNRDTSSASFYLLDSVSGNVLHTSSHGGVDTAATIASVISENWLAYSFTVDPLSDRSSRGYELVVAELFESQIPNDRGSLGAATNYSSMQPSSTLGITVDPYVVSQTWHIPERISHMAVTQTRQGITSRQLLATLPDSYAIVGIPRNVIDPRRPVGRDPTAAEAGEGLTKYAPVIEFDPKWYLNHRREVYGIRKIIASPALLESTSLVLAYGFDVFGTRVTPSFSFDVLGKDFNKLQMLATVAALAVGVLFVAPLVRGSVRPHHWLRANETCRFEGSRST